MRKVLKVLGYALLVLVVAVASFAAYVQLSPIPRYPVPQVAFTADRTPERVERGGRLVRTTCAMCHADPTTSVLTGRVMAEQDAAVGPTFVKNITGHPVKGIGAWSDAEIAYLIRTGVRRDGQMTPPWMPKLPLLADEDLKDIIAFLRSDDPLVKAADVDDRESEPTFLTKFLYRVAFKPYPWPAQPIAAPSPSDKLALGRYLVNARLVCHACHAPDFSKVNDLEPEKTPGYLGGGNPMQDLSGHKVYSANITPDQETGIGNWTEEQFRRTLRVGLRPDNRPLRYPMPLMPELTDDEVSAVYAYLRTVPALHIPRKATETAQVPTGASRGQQVYYKYSCNSCHGETGLGLHDLRGAAKRYPTDAEIIAFVKHPERTKPRIKMPTWDGVIQEDEYAPLAAHVRSLGK
jgi:mono/diheme cytochrome c family protein